MCVAILSCQEPEFKREQTAMIGNVTEIDGQPGMCRYELLVVITYLPPDKDFIVASCGQYSKGQIIKF